MVLRLRMPALVLHCWSFLRVVIGSFSGVASGLKSLQFSRIPLVYSPGRWGFEEFVVFARSAGLFAGPLGLEEFVVFARSAALFAGPLGA